LSSSGNPARAIAARRATDVLFLATVFTITFGQLRWGVGSAGRLRLFEVLAVLFVAAFAVERLFAGDRAFTRAEATIASFGILLAVVYLAGAYGLETHFSRVRFARGIATFAIHFSLLVAGVAYLARRPQRFYWRTLGWLCAGMAVNATYAGAQLVAAKAGVNLDQIVLTRLTGVQARSLAYALEAGPRVERARGLTTDPNHLGIMLLVPLLVLPPLMSRLEPGDRLRKVLGLSLAGLLVVEVLTLSRSAFLGLAAGLAVLLVLDRRAVLSRALLLPAAGVCVLLLAVISRHAHFYRRVLEARLNPNDHQAARPGHLGLYDFVGRTFHSHPFFGVGVNDFAAFYHPIQRDYGPLSFYVQSLVETGVVGTVVFAAFLGYVFLSLRNIYRLGDGLPRALAAGLTAALVGTMAANAFYLSMSFAYFYAFLILVLAGPVVFARAEARSRLATRVVAREQAMTSRPA
jgi:hypothetical protein